MKSPQIQAVTIRWLPSKASKRLKARTAQFTILGSMAQHFFIHFSRRSLSILQQTPGSLTCRTMHLWRTFLTESHHWLLHGFHLYSQHNVGIESSIVNSHVYVKLSSATEQHLSWNSTVKNFPFLSRSVSAGFSQHGKPQPASNDTGTAFCFLDYWIKKRQRWDAWTMWAYDLVVWPWRSPRLSVIYFWVLCQIMAHTGQTYHVTLTFNLGGHGTTRDVGLRPPSAHQLWSS